MYQFSELRAKDPAGLLWILNCISSTIFYIRADPILWFELCVWNFGEDGIDVHPPAALCAFVQILFGVQSGEFFSQSAAHKLIHRDTLSLRKAFCMVMDGVWKADAQRAHDRILFGIARSFEGVSTFTPKDSTLRKSLQLQVTM